MKFQSLLINKSIRFRIISIFVSIIVMMAIGSWASLSQQTMITNQYYRFMNNNISLSKLPIKVDQYAQAFERYLKEKDKSSLEEYYQINSHISEVLKSLNDDFVNNANTLIYYRSFSAMQEYQFEIVNKILQNNRFDEKSGSQVR
jgi:hypothetical protein